ncbi:MAG: Rpn family recombination-promoting nuclease/putative transposase [Sphaerospermopsis sp. SIO1G1]|nr:Rpn family recombination-promoting nuclease/putative transposase [Sphaerospermopsis sp. SIO1G1]
MYDNICKYLAENFQEDLAIWLLGSPVKLTELSPTELSNEPIRADSLILLQSKNLILHIEFQTNGEKKIPFRMLDYRVRGHRRFPDQEMRQVVIYLRKTDSELVYENSFKLNKTYHEFEVIRLWEQPTETFMTAPGLLPFAVLSQTEDPTMVLTEVAQAVAGIKNRQQQRDIAAASSILAGLVLNQSIINKMFRSEIMRESVIYQEILQEGEAKGKAEGRAEGKAETTRKLAINLLRIGMNLEQIAEVTELSLDQVQALQQEVQSF